MNLPARQTNTLAVISLVSGISGWIILPVIGSLVAIITGHMARGEIRRQPDQFEGDGLALAGLILGYAAFVLGALLILGFILFFGGLAWLAAASQ